MLAGVPAHMRATWPKIVLSQAKKLPGPELTRLREEVGPALWTEIRTASIVEWLPAESFMGLAEATERALGALASRALWRETLVVGFERALLKPLVTGAFALYGRSPGSLVRMAPSAWKLVSRDAADVSVERAPSESRIAVVLERMTPEFRRNAAVVEAFHACCEGVFSFLKTEGRVRSDTTRLGEGRAVLTLSWGGSNESRLR